MRCAAIDINLTWQTVTIVNLTGQAPVPSAEATLIPFSEATGHIGAGWIII